MSVVFLNGEFLPRDEAKISVFDRGFLFGDGVYEVFAVIAASLIDWRSHIARFYQNLTRIELELDITPEEMIESLRTLVSKNDLVEGLVYLQASRGEDVTRNFFFPKITQPTLMALCQQADILAPAELPAGISAITLPDVRWRHRDIKTTSLLAQVLAKREAEKHGATEAIMLDGDKVTEGASSAVIAVIDGKLVSRKLDNTVLPSITRKALSHLAATNKIELVERPILVAELWQAEEVMIVSATSLVMPVIKIDDRPIANGKPGGITLKLRKLYLEFAEQFQQ